MTYDEMIADDNGSTRALYTYTENGIQMGIGTVDEIMRTVKELSLDTDTMRFTRKG